MVLLKMKTTVLLYLCYRTNYHTTFKLCLVAYSLYTNKNVKKKFFLSNILCNLHGVWKKSIIFLKRPVFHFLRIFPNFWELNHSPQKIILFGKECLDGLTKARHITIHSGTNTTSHDHTIKPSSLNARKINWSTLTAQKSSS